MKTTLRTAGLLSFALTVLYLNGTAKGDTFCLDTPGELQAALTDAASNGSDDVIQIVKGTYLGNFTYNSGEAYGLTIEGGYIADCASRVIAPPEHNAGC